MKLTWLGNHLRKKMKPILYKSQTKNSKKINFRLQNTNSIPTISIIHQKFFHKNQKIYTVEFISNKLFRHLEQLNAYGQTILFWTDALDGSGARNDFDQLASDHSLTGAVELQSELVDHLSWNSLNWLMLF